MVMMVVVVMVVVKGAEVTEVGTAAAAVDMNVVLPVFSSEETVSAAALEEVLEQLGDESKDLTDSYHRDSYPQAELTT